MSELAEYARKLHEEQNAVHDRYLVPVNCPYKQEKLYDVRAVICDVYGTLINYWRTGFDEKDKRFNALLNAFRKVADTFEMTPFIVEMNPEEAPEKTLNDFYNGLIALNHEKLIKKGVTYPEIKIEEVWSLILLMLKRRGYDPAEHTPGSVDDFARYIAYTYNFHSLGRQLYPGVVDSLEIVKKNNIKLGILSNAQFYTAIDLTLMIRDQSVGKYDDYLELFDTDLIFYSFEYGVAKPNHLLFRKLYDALYEFQILPEQTVFVGNDLLIDIKPAAEAGMKTAFFTGDKEGAFIHDLEGTIVPDITFDSWSDLPSKLSFFSPQNQGE